MRTETRELFTISELSDSAREKAITDHRYWNTEDSDWWDGVYEDAARIGLKITSFDLGRRSSCEGYFTESGADVARAILAEHGPDCETVTDAENFLKALAALPLEDGEDCPSDDDLEECEKEFLHDLLESYRIMLEHECEYLESDEAVAESLEANGVEFLEDGGRP